MPILDRRAPPPTGTRPPASPPPAPPSHPPLTGATTTPYGARHRPSPDFRNGGPARGDRPSSRPKRKSPTTRPTYTCRPRLRSAPRQHHHRARPARLFHPLRHDLAVPRL